MVLTVEPGLYFQEDDLLVPEELRGIGIRIEDDIVVTADGWRNLSAALPRTSAEVEEWMGSLRLVDCHHFDAFRCRSCSLLEIPRPQQLGDKEAHARSLVPCARLAADDRRARTRDSATRPRWWSAARPTSPTLGILDRAQHGVDLRDCGLHSPGLTAALEVVAGFVTRADLAPYDVSRRAAASSSTSCSPSRPTAS